MGLNTRDAIEGRPNVETEHAAAVWEGRSRIVVDVLDFFACLWTVDDPAVSVEMGARRCLKRIWVSEMDEERGWDALEARW